MSVTETPSTNIFNVGNNGSVKGVQSLVTLSGPGTVSVDDSQATSQDQVTIGKGAAGDVQVGMAAQDQFFGPGGGLDCTGMSQLTLNVSHAAGDSVLVTPSVVTAFLLNGNATEFQSGQGATLALTGVTNPPQPSITSPGTGSFTLANGLQTVNFTNMGTTTAQGEQANVSIGAGMWMFKLLLNGQSVTPSSQPLELTPGMYTLATAGGAYGEGQASFEVGNGGIVSYASALQGVLLGAGTTSLTVQGRADYH